MSEDPYRARRLFQELILLPAAQWPAALDKACGDDSALRSLLHSALHSGSLPGTPPGGSVGLDDGYGLPGEEQAGTKIDRYKLLEKIGEGGMGTVWMAEQQEPIRRRVALKVIKLGMDTREVVGRFEAERQALAMMDHPNIAKVLDGGVTDRGRPYFVMELVRGISITQYCDRNKLGLKARLDLFIKVCSAIQHAHQKGIVHRDIKPANVLVNLQDGSPEPKVIDFGIAKALSAELTQRTLFTQHAQMIGTPEYMAPEQAGGVGLDIDTRADVYSLGVLLYELLTGTKPFDIRVALEVGYEELMRTIREVDPAKPSTRVSALGATGTAIADSRHASVESLSKRLRGDLDWIVMKALEKDRTRRYDTATGLAEDIGRYLNQEPVLAAPPSASYRLRRLMRRRWKTMAGVAAFGLLLIAGSTGTGIGWWKTRQANRALNVALEEKGVALANEKEQRALAEANERRASEAEQLAKANEKTAREVANFLNNDLLAAIAPEKEGLNVTVREVLAIASARLAGRFDGEPLVEAELQRTIGTSFQRLGDFQTAQDHLVRAQELATEQFGESSEQALSTALQVGSMGSKLGRFDEALALLERTSELSQSAFGPNAELSLKARAQVAETLWARGDLVRAESLFTELEATLKQALGEAHELTLATLSNHANALLDLGRLPEAEALQNQVLAAYRTSFGERDTRTLSAGEVLGEIYVAQGRVDDAEQLLLASQATREDLLGPDHPATANGLGRLGVHYYLQGHVEEAEAYFARGYEQLRRTLGSEHPFTLQMANNLASAWSSLGRKEEALELRQATLAADRRTLGDQHPYTLRAIGNLALLLQELGRYDEAEAAYLETIALREKALGPDHPDTWSVLENLSGLKLAQERYTESIALTEQVLEGRKRVLGPNHPAVARTLYNLGIVASSTGDTDAARERFEEALLGAQAAKATDVATCARAQLASLDYDAGDRKAAQAGYLEAAADRKAFGIEDTLLADWLFEAGRAASKQDDFAAAVNYIGQSLVLRRKLLGNEHVDTLHAMISLTRMLQASKQFKQAEERALEVHTILLQTDGEGSARVGQARKLLANLYEAWERPEDAARWRD
ncbi:MAG: serine/threonine protein kinase [Planctomycetes bacterium]|nr:serine/threonine protein kinase [Planctomycetota bacterium]MCB9913427.1 serine/threonine protein kinase [Planctomycetota bacterium]